MEIFASCSQELHVYSRKEVSYLQYEVVAGETSCSGQGMDMITDMHECRRASVFLNKGTDIFSVDSSHKGHYKVPRGCFMNEPMQSYADSSGTIRTYSPRNELNKASGLATKKVYFANPTSSYWKVNSVGTDDCNTFPCICRKGVAQECQAKHPVAGTDGACGWNHGKKKCSTYVNPQFKHCSPAGWCGETPDHMSTNPEFNRFDDAAIPEICRPEKKDGCGMYNVGRSGGCGWSVADKVGRRSQGGMGSDHECNQACKRLGPGCKYAAYKTGFCHMFKTCSGNEGSGWTTYEKRCSNSAEMEALAETGGEWTQEDLATFGFASIGLAAVLYGGAKFFMNNKALATHNAIPSHEEL
jgi:hypothetical protein